MVGQTGKKKPKGSRTIDKVAVPSFALTAVPSSSTMPESSAPVNEHQMTLPPHLPGKSGNQLDEFSDPESSLFDYQQMDEAGFSNVGFGTWPNLSRKARDGQIRESHLRQSAYSTVYAEPGDVEGLEKGNSADNIRNISDLYATPMKKKGKKSSTRNTPDSHGEYEGNTLSGTRQDVQEEMRKVHDMPAAEETIVKSARQDVHISVNYPESSRHTDSGRGSTRPGSQLEEEDLEAFQEFFHSPPVGDLVQISDFSQKNHKAVENAMASLDLPVGERGGVTSNGWQLLDYKDIEGLTQLPKASNSNSLLTQLPSGRISMSKTPSSPHILESDFELQQLKVQNEDLQAELMSLKRVVDAIKDGDMEGAQNLYVWKELEKLKDENETLKTTVHRLNVELSDYQAKYRPVDPVHLKKTEEISGLPSKGPIPSWLISKRYLAPLFLAYDDHLEEKKKAIEEFKAKLSIIRSRAEDVLKENQRLRISSVGLCSENNEWLQLQEQARLVLEENQILMEQLEVQTHKSKEMYSVHIAEISRMAKKLALSEGEKADVERELQEICLKYRELKHSYDQTMMETGSQVNVHTHINSISDLKRTIAEEKEKFDKEMETLKIKLKASEEERKNQGLEMIDMTADNKRLKAEIKTMQKSVKRAQSQMILLQRAVELSEDKELITQEQLAQVIKVAEKTALERDTVYKVIEVIDSYRNSMTNDMLSFTKAREQQQENQMTVNKMVDGSVVMGKLEEKLKLYRMKAQAKLSTVSERLKEQDEAFNSQKKEYERELQYLRLLLKEKEEIINSLEKDKKDIETDLNTMWQTANSENHRVKVLLRTGGCKMKENSNIGDALNEELEYEEELHFLKSQDE